MVRFVDLATTQAPSDDANQSNDLTLHQIGGAGFRLDETIIGSQRLVESNAVRPDWCFPTYKFEVRHARQN